MIYNESIFICLAAPLLLTLFLLKGDARRFNGFFILGLLCCLLSAYINSYIAAAYLVGDGYAAFSMTPVCEEIMKALPVFIYAAIFKPERGNLVTTAIAVGIGFATLENASYISRYGTDIPFVLIRGFSAGVMHAICAAILGYGLEFIGRRRNMAVVGSFAVLCASSTFHATYNLLVSSGDWRRMVGYLLPVVMAAVVLTLVRRPFISEE